MKDLRIGGPTLWALELLSFITLSTPNGTLATVLFSFWLSGCDCAYMFHARLEKSSVSSRKVSRPVSWGLIVHRKVKSGSG
uniref:Uncharacterized protein n=1 Tax=Anopheles darlingi TaxID=43151 RepID=A0A2M4DQR1_ANODA